MATGKPLPFTCFTRRSAFSRLPNAPSWTDQLALRRTWLAPRRGAGLRGCRRGRLGSDSGAAPRAALGRPTHRASARRARPARGARSDCARSGAAARAFGLRGVRLAARLREPAAAGVGARTLSHAKIARRLFGRSHFRLLGFGAIGLRRRLRDGLLRHRGLGARRRRVGAAIRVRVVRQIDGVGAKPARSRRQPASQQTSDSAPSAALAPAAPATQPG